MDAFFLNTNSAMHGDIGIVKEDDLVIILTKSGETPESIYLYEQLKKRNAKIWMISFRKDSTLSRRIKKTILLDLDHEGDLWNIMPNNSTTINLIVLQGLVMQIAKERGLELEDFKRNHPGGYIGRILGGG